MDKESIVDKKQELDRIEQIIDQNRNVRSKSLFNHSNNNLNELQKDINHNNLNLSNISNQKIDMDINEADEKNNQTI